MFIPQHFRRFHFYNDRSVYQEIGVKMTDSGAFVSNRYLLLALDDPATRPDLMRQGIFVNGLKKTDPQRIIYFEKRLNDTLCIRFVHYHLRYVLLSKVSFQLLNFHSIALSSKV